MHDPTQKDSSFLILVPNIEVKFFMKMMIRKKTLMKFLKKLMRDLMEKFKQKISKIKNYQKAEDYHQRYLEKNR